MRDIITNEDFGLSGCVGVGCLLILLGGFLTSVILNTGSDSADEQEAAAAQAREETPAAREEGAVLPGEEPERPPETPQTPSPEPADEPDPVCDPILAQVAWIESCEVLTLATSHGATVYLGVPSEVDEATAAAIAVDAMQAVPRQVAISLGGIGVEDPSGSWVVDARQARQCAESADPPARCLAGRLTRFGSS